MFWGGSREILNCDITIKIFTNIADYFITYNNKEIYCTCKILQNTTNTTYLVEINLFTNLVPSACTKPYTHISQYTMSEIDMKLRDMWSPDLCLYIMYQLYSTTCSYRTQAMT